MAGSAQALGERVEDEPSFIQARPAPRMGASRLGPGRSEM